MFSEKTQNPKGKIKIEELYKSFNQKTNVLKNINLVVKPGEFLVLLGPSGCGKSTLLRIIAGLEKPTKGQIYIDEVLINELPPKDRDIAMVFQSYALYPHLTVYDNIAFSLKLKKIKKEIIDFKVKEIAKLLGIEHHLKSKPREISGGERQRVAVGRAIIRNPKVFLFDEPLSNLDAQLRTQMRAEFKNLHSKLKITTIYVTHDQIEAMTLGDRIVVLKDGEILQEGIPQEVYKKPQKKFVAGFLGSPPMNFICGKIEGNTFYFSEAKKKLNKIKNIEGDVFLGIRPEDIIIDNNSHLKAKVEFKEVLGNSFIIYAKLQGKTLKIKTSKDINQEEIGIDFPEEKIFFYSKKTENLIYPK